MIETFWQIVAIVFLLLLAALVIGLLWRRYRQAMIIFDYQRGLKYVNGQPPELLEPGRYSYFSHNTRIEAFDMRSILIQISGQDVLCRDKVGIKVSLSATYQIVDPKILMAGYEDYYDHLYHHLQIALRDTMATMELDEALDNRNSIAQAISLALKPDFMPGLKVLTVEIKDLMLPADLKKVYADVVKARKEGQAALERARGEAATLRNLANTARMMEKNPELLKLRLIQTMESTQGNTYHVALDSKPSEAVGTSEAE